MHIALIISEPEHLCMYAGHLDFFSCGFSEDIFCMFSWVILDFFSFSSNLQELLIIFEHSFFVCYVIVHVFSQSAASPRFASYVFHHVRRPG